MTTFHDEERADYEAGALLDAELRDEGQQQPARTIVECCPLHGTYMAFSPLDIEECPTCVRIDYEDTAGRYRKWNR